MHTIPCDTGSLSGVSHSQARIQDRLNRDEMLNYLWKTTALLLLLGERPIWVSKYRTQLKLERIPSAGERRRGKKSAIRINAWSQTAMLKSAGVDSGWNATNLFDHILNSRVLVIIPTVSPQLQDQKKCPLLPSSGSGGGGVDHPHCTHSFNCHKDLKQPS